MATEMRRARAVPSGQQTARQSCWREPVPREEGQVHQGCSRAAALPAGTAGSPQAAGYEQGSPGSPALPPYAGPPSSTALDQSPDAGTKLIP